MRDSNIRQKHGDSAEILNALQMRCNAIGLPEMAELLELFGKLPNRNQERCRRRIRQIMIEAKDQVVVEST